MVTRVINTANYVVDACRFVPIVGAVLSVPYGLKDGVKAVSHLALYILKSGADFFKKGRTSGKIRADAQIRANHLRLASKNFQGFNLNAINIVTVGLFFPTVVVVSGAQDYIAHS